jgi:hypothetical protein
MRPSSVGLQDEISGSRVSIAGQLEAEEVIAAATADPAIAAAIGNPIGILSRSSKGNHDLPPAVAFNQHIAICLNTPFSVYSCSVHASQKRGPA